MPNAQRSNAKQQTVYVFGTVLLRVNWGEWRQDV